MFSCDLVDLNVEPINLTKFSKKWLIQNNMLLKNTSLFDLLWTLIILCILKFQFIFGWTRYLNIIKVHNWVWIPFVVGVSGNWIEIAYGTSSGTVRVIVQHPETVGHGPQLFQTFTVHQSSVTKVCFYDILVIMYFILQELSFDQIQFFHLCCVGDTLWEISCVRVQWI